MIKIVYLNVIIFVYYYSFCKWDNNGGQGSLLI